MIQDKLFRPTKRQMTNQEIRNKIGKVIDNFIKSNNLLRSDVKPLIREKGDIPIFYADNPNNRTLIEEYLVEKMSYKITFYKSVNNDYVEAFGLNMNQ